MNTFLPGYVRSLMFRFIILVIYIFVFAIPDIIHAQATTNPPVPTTTSVVPTTTVPTTTSTVPTTTSSVSTITTTVPDRDDDGVLDDNDNCIISYNPGQLNSDNDSYGDVCDNCPFNDNEGQEDADGDGIGDVCDSGSAAIPTLSEWGMIILVILILGISVLTLKKRKET